MAGRRSVPRLEIRDPGLASLRSATRAAIVMPAVFAFADKVIGDPQLATFAAFGSFAMLVLVEFGGPLRMRFIAYVGLACAGAANITVGTLCSRDPWVAAGAMFVVGFAILFSGVLNSYVAAAATSGLLTFILAVMIPAPVDALPARLEGWALAAGVAIAAQMLLWPVPASSSERGDAARAIRAIADLAAASLAHETERIGELTRAAGEAVRGVHRSFLAVPHRQSGATGPQAAFGSLVDELGWLMSFVAPPGERPGLRVCESETADAVAASVEALRASASVLEGAAVRPDVDRLDLTRDALARALARQIPELPSAPDDEMLVSALGPAFRIRALSFGARQVALDSEQVVGGAPERAVEERTAHLDAVTRPVLSALETTEQVAAEHASARSVWFQNSLRGAVGLALAVYVAQRSGLQHAFWVVLGTLSVLRSNALSTGWSILSALAGTAVGILIGAALVLAIGTHEAVLWAVLPVAVLVGSYAPRAISFAAGQAGFTVVLFVLFNLIQPSGWRVGLVRIEDVAIGFAISLGVGLLFWPRGAGKLLRENLAYAYARSADYVVAAQKRLVEDSTDSALARAADAATAAAHRLEDAFRQYLAERSPRGASFESAPAFVAGAERVRRVGQSLSELAAMSRGARLAGCGANLDGESHSARSWYIALGDSLVHETAVPPPHIRDTDGRRRLLECVRDAVAGGDESKLRPALDLLWASQHLDVLWRLEEYLGHQSEPADVEPAPSEDDALPEPV